MKFANGREVANKMYFVYVLKSLVNNRLYTGSANNLDRRIQEHNSGIYLNILKTADRLYWFTKRNIQLNQKYTYEKYF